MVLDVLELLGSADAAEDGVVARALSAAAHGTSCMC